MNYNKEYQQSYNKLNRDKVNSRARAYYRMRADKDPQYVRNRQKRKKDIKKLVDELKSMFGCAKCPERDPDCLEFHHLNEKRLTVAAMCNRNMNISEIIDEMLKCAVLCANCHRKVHAPKKDKTEFNNPVFQDILNKVRGIYSS